MPFNYYNPFTLDTYLSSKDMRAILWDGIKQLSGNLTFGVIALDFVFDDFTKTNLSFHIDYRNIEKIEFVRIYGIAEGGVAIFSKGGRKDVFVVEDPADINRFINLKID